ncbi:unnamed protein product, partial [Rotaria magnacalcarata]
MEEDLENQLNELKLEREEELKHIEQKQQ